MRPAAALALAALAACGKGEPPKSAPSPAAAEAKRLLAEAGFPDGKGFPKLELLYNTDEIHQNLAASVQETWRTALGIDVSLRNLEFPVFQGQVQRGDFDVARQAWNGEYLDPLAFLELFTADSHNNPTGWSSPEFDRLVAKSHEAADPAARKELLDRAESLLLEQAPVAPVFHYVAHNLIKPFVKGVHLTTRDIHPLQGVTLEGPGAPADGVLIFNGGAEPQSLDPALSTDIAGYKILMHLYEGLVMPDAVEARPAPALAESWTTSADGLVWTFKLRDAKWSNGDAVVASDFVWSWRRVVTPATASRYAQRMYVVKGAREIARDGADPSTLGVRAVDDRTLEVTLLRPTPYFLQLLCMNLYFPVHRPTVERLGPSWWTRIDQAVVNGPYRMSDWTLKEKKTFVKNPAYRAAKDVKLAKFVFLAVEKAETAFTLYETGACHWLFRVPLGFVDIPRPDHQVNPYNVVYYYAFNTRKKPLDDPRVRRALGLVIEREKIVKHILRGGETAAERLVPPTSR